DELAELESRDVGKPIREARGRDVPVAAQTWLHHAGWPTKILGTTNPSDPGVFSYTIREPLGVVGAITPWNYPLVIASWKLAAAERVADELVERLVERVERLRVGPGLDPSTEIGPIISARQRDRVLELYASAVEEGSKAAAGGGRATVEGSPDGYFVQPTVFVGTTNEMRINREEI